MIRIQWDLSLPFYERFSLAKTSFVGPCFMDVVACASWNIQPKSLGRRRVRFQIDLLLHRFRVNPALVQTLIDWLLALFVHY